MKRRLVLALALVCATRPAAAETREGFALDRFEPAERGSGWLVLDTLDFATSFGATVDYAHKPLVARDPTGAERAAIVRHQTFVHAGAALAIAERARIGLNVPLAIYQDGEPVTVGGETLKAASAPALGDVRGAVDVRLLGDGRGAFSLAAGVRGWLPTGVRGQYTGDGALRVSPHLVVAGAFGIVVWSARSALVFRAHDTPYAGAPLGSEIALAGGVGVRAGAWQVGPEVFASSAFARGPLFAADTTPVEALLGGRWDAPLGLRFGAGAGTSLARGYGSPAARVLFSVEWSATRGLEKKSDRDGDGVLDDADACPDWPGPKSDDPSENGCPRDERVPDEDTDGDGISDRDDACPVAKGIATRDPMTNGCPEGEPRKLAIVTAHEIKIGEQVRFATDSAELVESDAILDAVRALLVDHPELARVRVEGHTDDVGDPSYNEMLSQRRAASVTTWLVTHGIEASRLESVGKGAREPLDRSGTEEARSKNRRVVFVVVERLR